MLVEKATAIIGASVVCGYTNSDRWAILSAYTGILYIYMSQLCPSKMQTKQNHTRVPELSSNVYSKRAPPPARTIRKPRLFRYGMAWHFQLLIIRSFSPQEDRVSELASGCCCEVSWMTMKGQS